MGQNKNSPQNRVLSPWRVQDNPTAGGRASTGEVLVPSGQTPLQEVLISSRTGFQDNRTLKTGFGDGHPVENNKSPTASVGAYA
jgi:hypothetical protein